MIEFFRFSNWAILTALICVGAVPARAAEITVFAASSMIDSVSKIGKNFESHSPEHQVRYVFASSSALARQIIAGAPAHVFISANSAWMHIAVREDAIVGETVTPVAGNRLVLVAGPNSMNSMSDTLPGIVTSTVPLSEYLDMNGRGRLAIGDPAHVPAGQYARQALEYLGLWHTVSDRLAPMPHVRAALNLVERDEVPLGIVYASDLTLAPTVRVIGTFPSESHLPISYLSGVVKPDNSGSRAFVAYLTSTAAAEVFQHYGFSLTLPDPG